MSRAVYVSVVTVGSLILYVSGVDSNTALLFLGSIVDLVERLNFRETLLGQHGSDGSGQSSFAVVNVADSTDVDMRFGSFEFFFSHNYCYFDENIFLLTKQPRTCVAYPRLQ